jgi:hypothetical protein
METKPLFLTPFVSFVPAPAIIEEPYEVDPLVCCQGSNWPVCTDDSGVQRRQRD